MDSEHSVPPRIDAQGHPFEQDAEVAPCGCSLLPGGLLCAVHALEVAAPGYTDLFDSPPDIISDIPALELTAPPVPPAPIAKSEREQKAADEAARIASITSVLDETVPLAGELERERWEVLRGDCRLVMARLPENSYDSVVCDPPYGMSEEPDVEAVLKHWLAGDEYEHMTKGGFMGRTWDSFVPGPKFWEAAYRCLKPGGYIAAYSSSRTWDLLSIAMRMAGFEIRDTCMWVYGCISADTEVFIDNRWVRHGDVEAGQRILGFNPDTGNTEWMPIEAVQRYGYNDVAYRLTSPHTDQIVSRNHRCLVMTDNGYEFQTAETLGETAIVPIIQDFSAVQKSSIAAYSDYEAKGYAGVPMHGMYGSRMEAEGMAEEDCSSHLFSSMQRSVARAGLGDSRIKSPSSMDGSIETVVPCQGKWTEAQMVEWRDNAVPQEGQLLDRSGGTLSRDVLFDGHEEWLCGRTPSVGSASDRKMFTANRGSASYQPQREGQSARESGVVCEPVRTQAVRENGIAVADLVRVEPISYRGVVWCPTVPTGAFVARRNGKVFITGNSGMPKGLNVGRALEEMLGQEHVCPECQGVPRAVQGAPSVQGDIFASAEWEQAWDSFTPPEGPCATCKDKGTIRITPDEALRWKGWNTALKPAWEPIIIGRKPLAEKSIVDNIMAYGTGAMNIDATRVGSRANNPQVQGAYKGSTVGIAGAREGGKVYDQGRWPANVLMSHSEECRMVGTQKIPGASGWSSTGSKQGQSGSLVGPNSARDPKPDSFTDADGMETVEVWECAGDCPVQSINQQASVAIDGIGGSGASRFFYCAKASRSERDAGLEDFETRPAGGMAGRRDGTLEGDPVVGKNPHPTVKPIGVMRWLSRLLTPDGGKILDPFAGSGSEGCAAVLEGFRYTGIELDADDEGMCDIARARIRYWEREGDREAEKAAIEASQLSMFDMLG